MASKGSTAVNKRARSQRQEAYFQNKIVFMKLLLKEKELLTGEFKGTAVTFKAKDIAWKGIHEQLLSEYGINLVPQGRDYTYLRDSVYAQIRNATKVGSCLNL